MPAPTDEEFAEFICDNGPYRLACEGGCFREDFDGVRGLPTDWKGVYEFQSLKDSLTYYDDPDDEPPGFNVMDWETHRGTCPRCQK